MWATFRLRRKRKSHPESAVLRCHREQRQDGLRPASAFHLDSFGGQLKKALPEFNIRAMITTN
jgi:hypothetical protein